MLQNWNSIATFMACMLMHPDVQRRGQAEIDRVVGTARLPDFTDRASLPYTECILQETMRYVPQDVREVSQSLHAPGRLYPVAPLGVPHCAAEDDEYRGMRIPKGAIVMAHSQLVLW